MITRPCATVATAVTLLSSAALANGVLHFASQADNDLYVAVARTEGLDAERHDSAEAALRAAGPGDAVLLLADRYPAEQITVQPDQIGEALASGARCYVEYGQAAASNVDAAEPKASSVHRLVVAGDWLGDALPQLSILQANGLHYNTIDPTLAPGSSTPLLLAARVAGFDTANLGLPSDRAPVLASASDGKLLVAATGLSHYRRGRYAPVGSWRTLWANVLMRLLDRDHPIELAYREPMVRATFRGDERLAEDCERSAVRRSIDWFANAKILIHPDWAEAFVTESGRADRIDDAMPLGDGTLGSMEGVTSIIHADGRQGLSTIRRGDCVCETALAYALSGDLLDDSKLESVAGNLLDYYLVDSEATKNERADPNHGAYGLIAWGIDNRAWYIANYGDDNARVMLAAAATAGLLGTDRWNETLARCVVGNLRTTGKLGFRTDRIDIGPLGANGWRHYFEASPVSPAPHFEAYLWASYLWAYARTGDELLLDRARTALKMTLAQYPNGLRWTNGLAQERARIVLPLAWLVRVDDTPENRAMLHTAIDGLLSIQEECGAIREELGPPGRGMFPPPSSNEGYGINEASLIARTGDPVADLLYTNNFALVGLHEAAAATGNPRIRAAEDRLAAFLVRIQGHSKEIPEVDGGWMRAFDFQRWEPWGSNADHGWGAWSIESGWTQGWITSVLAMRQTDRSLWDLVNGARIERVYPEIRAAMLDE